MVPLSWSDWSTQASLLQRELLMSPLQINLGESAGPLSIPNNSIPESRTGNQLSHQENRPVILLRRR